MSRGRSLFLPLKLYQSLFHVKMNKNISLEVASPVLMTFLLVTGLRVSLTGFNSARSQLCEFLWPNFYPSVLQKLFFLLVAKYNKYLLVE